MPRLEGTEVAPGLYLPLVDVTFRLGSNKAADLTALVDSGADSTLAPFEVFETAGLTWDDLTDEVDGAGAGAGFKTRGIDCTVSFRKTVFAKSVRVSAPGTCKVILLGRQDFFRHFVVRFNWHKNPPVFDIDPVV